MATTLYNTVYDKDGNIVSQEQISIPATKLEKAIDLLNSLDPASVTNLAQARQILVLHHRILANLLPYLLVSQIFDDGDQPTS